MRFHGYQPVATLAARRIAANLTAAGVPAAVHENHRYRPWFREVLDAHARGVLGKLRFLRIEHFNATSPAEVYKQESETGVWLEYGSHLADMMRSLLGNPLRVWARSHRITSRVAGESLVTAMFEFPEATATIEVGWKNSAVRPSGSGTCSTSWCFPPQALRTALKM